MKSFFNQPDVEAQRAAMKKLEFLVGTWEGSAQISSLFGVPLNLSVVEHNRLAMSGLVITSEWIVTSKTDSRVVLHCLANSWYNDRQRAYRIQAFGEGHVLEAELAVYEDQESIQFEVRAGPALVTCVKRSAEGSLHQHIDVSIGRLPSVKFLEVMAKRKLTSDHPASDLS